jgi:hypothetical protein
MQDHTAVLIGHPSQVRPHPASAGGLDAKPCPDSQVPFHFSWSVRHDRERRDVRLPGIDRAVVDPAKVRDYLLNPGQPAGGQKAMFFASLGYRRDRWRWLARDLAFHAIEHGVSQGAATAYGRKHVARGNLRGPRGPSATIIVVWIVLRGEDFPRLITAYPRGNP